MKQVYRVEEGVDLSRGVRESRPPVFDAPAEGLGCLLSWCNNDENSYEGFHVPMIDLIYHFYPERTYLCI